MRGDIDSLSVGVAILGFHIQAARDREFKKIVFDRKYESDERFSPADAALDRGAYWWRIAVVDLLGTEGPFSEPRYYTVGVKRAERAPGAALGAMLTVFSPDEGAELSGDSVRVIGVLRDDTLHLEIAGNSVRIDADGNFVAIVRLKDGVNEIEIVVSDGKGNVTRVSRRVTRPLNKSGSGLSGLEADGGHALRSAGILEHDLLDLERREQAEDSPRRLIR